MRARARLRQEIKVENPPPQADLVAARPGKRYLPAGSRFLATLGPGLVVMLADTDAGSVITAAESGAEWGYRLLLFQVAIVPLLYLVQELAVRLALGSGRGMNELIRARYGASVSSAMTTVLAVSCFGSLLTQLSGLAGVGQLLGVPVWETVTGAVVGLSVMVLTGSYHSVERITILFGACELAFVYAAWRSHPDPTLMLEGLGGAPMRDPRYLYLLAANLGTSLMPWAIFYQQSAVVDKGLTFVHLKHARLDTFIGAVLCQIVTSGILVTAAANAAGNSLGDIPAIASVFERALGGRAGTMVFAAGLMGGALVATVVVCLTVAWAIGEATGLRHSLEHHPTEAPWFYFSFVALLAMGGAFVASGIDLVKVPIAIGVINALLLPPVLFCLFMLVWRELAPSLRPAGLNALLLALLFVTTSALALYSGTAGVFG
jgi:Mn2+/Fe2+ NRAMP family transporter